MKTAPLLHSDTGHRSGRERCLLNLLIEIPTNAPMRNPISLPPQFTFQATALVAAGFAAEISEAQQGLPMQQQLQFGHGHDGERVHDIDGGREDLRRVRGLKSSIKLRLKPAKWRNGK
jgi:hypothetical protein